MTSMVTPNDRMNILRQLHIGVLFLCFLGIVNSEFCSILRYVFYGLMIYSSDLALSVENQKIPGKSIMPCNFLVVRPVKRTKSIAGQPGSKLTGPAVAERPEGWPTAHWIHCCFINSPSFSKSVYS